MNDPLIDPVWWMFGGRLHPLLLHLPIGIFIGLGVLELFAALRKRPAAPTSLVLFAGLAGALAAGSGWLLHEEPGYGGELLDWHEWLGIATAACGLLTALLRLFGRVGGYRRMLLLTIVVMSPTAHFGASMTHGTDYLFEPFRAPERDDARPAPFVGLTRADDARVTAPLAPEASAPLVALASYTADIAPILSARCETCHSERSRKGRLRLDAPEHILKGGVIGPALVPGDLGASEIVYRLRLPADDEDRMPPPDKPQPSAAEVALIEAWIAAGAPFEANFELPAGAARPGPLPVTVAEEEPPAAATAAQPEPPAPRALAALRAALVHVQPVAEGADELWIDFAAPAADIDDAAAVALLEPVRAHVVELSLARTQIGDAALALVAEMGQLRRLDLRATRVGDAGLSVLRDHAALSELVLVDTRLSDAAVDSLLALPALATVWLWDSGLSAGAIERLRVERPELRIEAGEADSAAALETEAELRFTSDAPLVDAPPAPAGLAALNTICPVSGSPVNAKYAIVFEGRVIGFCCPNCPKEFWTDPERFRAELP